MASVLRLLRWALLFWAGVLVVWPVLRLVPLGVSAWTLVRSYRESR